MSYLNQAQDHRRRLTAIAGVTAIHAAIGLALVVGLTVSGFVQEEDVWDPFTITPDPQPKPPPPEPRDQRRTESIITAPTPLIPIVADPIDIVVRDPIEDRTLVVDRGPIADPVADPPRPTFTPRGARPSNGPQGWLSNADYPVGTEAEGIAAYRLIVGTNDRVSACDLTRSTGNRQLDSATCRFIQRRARFEAATDESGARVVGSYTGTVKWQIPD